MSGINSTISPPPPIPTSHYIGKILSASYPTMMQREIFSLLLSSSFENVVDNLTTKPDLTFDDVKLRLLNTASASTSPTHHKDETVLPASSLSSKKNKDKDKDKQKATTSFSPDDKQQENSDGCSWCRNVRFRVKKYEKYNSTKKLSTPTLTETRRELYT
jgi:hypothetical protein